MTNVPITFGSGQASIAGDTVGATTYQQIKVVDGTVGGSTPLKVNPDGSISTSIIGIPNVGVAGGNVGLLGGTAFIGNVGIASGSVVALASGNQSVSGTVGASILGTVPITQGGPLVASVSGTVGASIIGTVPVNIVSGGTTGSVSGTVGASIIGWAPVQLSNSSVITVSQGSIAAVIVGGSIAASFTPPANQSVSGTVQTDVRSSVAVVIIGGSIAASFTPPANQSVSGTVQTDVRSSVAVVIIGGSIAASFTPPANQSVSGTVGASVIGQVPVFIIGGSIAASFTPPANQSVSGAVSISNFPTTQNVSGSVVATQGTSPWIITGSVQGVFTGTANQSVSGTVGASVIGTVPVTQGGTWIASVFGNVSVLGTVPVTQTTSPWVITGSIQGSFTPFGSVITVWQSPSIVGTYAEDAPAASGDKGFLVMGARNDTLSSVTSNDGDYSSHVVGPAGELIAENAPLTKWVSGTADFRNGNAGASIVAIASGGSSVFTYITGVQIANMGSASVLVALVSGGSTLGYSIAPAGGGSNIYYQNGLKTPANFGFAASISGVASVLVSAQGFISKT